jgi:hypothetical protein
LRDVVTMCHVIGGNADHPVPSALNTWSSARVQGDVRVGSILTRLCPPGRVFSPSLCGIQPPAHQVQLSCSCAATASVKRARLRRVMHDPSYTLCDLSPR